MQLVQIAPMRRRRSPTNLLGKKLVTIQTGPEGKTVNRVFVEEGCKIARELYLGIVLDRAAAKPVLMVSSEGGVEIEKVAAETPELILKEHFDPHVGLQPYQVRKLCYRLGLNGAERRQRREVHAGAVPDVRRSSIAAWCEINPLVVTEAGELVALDGKISFDDNALFRHKDLAELRDLSEEDPAEVRASNAGLSLRQARRQHRLPGERRRPGDEHDGHHQAARRRAGQLSRRRRRRERASR